MKVGKIGKINIEAVKKNKEQFERLGITRCEVSNKDFALSFAHKQKRIEYRSCPEKLWDINEVLLLTIPIHNLIENNRDLTKKLFECLRPVGKADGMNNARRLIVNYLEKIGKHYLIDNIL
jgi:hypothetical protein